MRGVYAIQCDDGRAYVGGSVAIARRWGNHRYRLRRGDHHSPALQAAWELLGQSAFSFIVLEVVETGDLLEAEQRWIDRLRAAETGFNTSPTAGSLRGLARPPSTRAKIADGLRGRKPSAESRAKMSASQRGRRHDATTLAKMAANKGGESNPQAKLTEEHVKEIRRRCASGEPQRRLAEAYGLSSASVSQIVHRKNWKHVK